MHSVIKEQTNKQTNKPPQTTAICILILSTCHIVDADSHLPERAGEKKCKQDFC